MHSRTQSPPDTQIAATDQVSRASRRHGTRPARPARRRTAGR
jgi:hypothetical protein